MVSRLCGEDIRVVFMDRTRVRRRTRRENLDLRLQLGLVLLRDHILVGVVVFVCVRGRERVGERSGGEGLILCEHL